MEKPETNQSHPVTPPPELVRMWATWRNVVDEESFWRRITTEAAQWGADQELEACRQWLEINGAPRKFIDGLLAARRPKPPSLKEQALIGLSRIEQTGEFFSDGMKDLDAIRRALELLPDDTTH
jgi:hypothetical protein